MSSAADRNPGLFRVGFGSSLFSEVNENDARAAIKVWGEAIAKGRGIPTDPDPLIFKDASTLSYALEHQVIDAVVITIADYANVQSSARLFPIFTLIAGDHNTEQYLLVVHKDSNIQTVSDLKDCRMLVHLNPRLCLALPWLDTIFSEQELSPASNYVASISTKTKLAQVVLPVFFRQSDACIVGRSGFETMKELNPQVGQKLKVIAASPELVTEVLALRADYQPAFREQLISALLDLHKTPAGQQVLTLFHGDKVELRPLSSLTSTLALITGEENPRASVEH